MIEYLLWAIQWELNFISLHFILFDIILTTAYKEGTMIIPSDSQRREMKQREAKHLAYGSAAASSVLEHGRHMRSFSWDCTLSHCESLPLVSSFIFIRGCSFNSKVTLICVIDEIPSFVQQMIGVLDARQVPVLNTGKARTNKALSWFSRSLEEERSWSYTAGW